MVDFVSTDHAGADLWIVALHGEHDLTTEPDVRAALDHVRAQGTRVLIDLSDATFIDSTVIHALIVAHQHAQATPTEQLAILAPPGSMPAHVLDVIGGSDFLPIHDSRPDALAHLGRG